MMYKEQQYLADIEEKFKIYHEKIANVSQNIRSNLQKNISVGNFVFLLYDQIKEIQIAIDFLVRYADLKIMIHKIKNLDSKDMQSITDIATKNTSILDNIDILKRFYHTNQVFNMFIDENTQANTSYQEIVKKIESIHEDYLTCQQYLNQQAKSNN